MFARPGRSIFVCLRCQSRLAERSLQSPSLSGGDRPSRKSQRRWQSTAVAVAEDIQTYQDDQYQVRPRPRPDYKYKAERSWKPNRTAELGVSSLGKPAEVLLLEERDRLIPKAPTDVEERREGDVISAAWNTDNQSLSPEQLTKNIEHIRNKATIDRCQEDVESHRRVQRKRLHKEFSAKQLSTYIEQKRDAASKPFKHRRQLGKVQMARYIFKHIWGIHIQDSAESVEPEKSQQVQVSSAALELLLLSETAPLRQVAEQFNVKIDFFRDPSKILVTGPLKSIEAARKALVQWQEKVMQQKIVLEDYARAGADINDEKLCSELRQIFRVHLKRRKQSFDIYYHEDTALDIGAIKRHLLLALRSKLPAAPCIMWPECPEDGSHQLAIGYPGIDLGQSNGAGIRRVASPEEFSTPSVPQMSTAQKSAFSLVYKATRAALTFSTPRLKKLAAYPGVRTESKASFGQALVEGTVSKSEQNPDGSQESPTFVTRIPLLSQFLAKRSLWKETTAQALPSVASSESADVTPMEVIATATSQPPSKQFNYELILSSAAPSQSPELPDLRIQLFGDDFHLALNQPLQIRSIATILARRTSYLRLPTQVVDIKLESQMMFDIYQEGSPSHPDHAPLLSQLAEYFTAAGSLPGGPKFAAFTTLSLPDALLPRPHDGRSSAKSGGHQHEYLLESATAFDVASYRPPFHSKLCLEHVVFLSGDGDHSKIDDADSGREVLQLVERPRLSSPTAAAAANVRASSSTKSEGGASPVKFVKLFNSAYELALLLGSGR